MSSYNKFNKGNKRKEDVGRNATFVLMGIQKKKLDCFSLLIIYMEEWIDICLKYVNQMKMDRYETIWENMNFGQNGQI